MQSVRKKAPVSPHRSRLILLFAALILLVVLAISVSRLNQTDKSDWPTYTSTAQNLFEYSPGDVASITITRRGEAPWTVTQTDGLLTLAGEGGFTLSETTSAALLDAACIIPCESVLTDDPAEYTHHLADFGLDAPRYEAAVTYTDGVTAVLRIGNPGMENNAWYYMTVDGDHRLFSFSRSMVESLFVSRDSLWDVESPTIHKPRIDQITLTGPEGIEAQWTLAGSITDMDAVDKWQITEPYIYPADSTVMTTLLSNIANLRLGAYVCPATEEALAAHGFDTPRLTIDIHMAAGIIGTTNADGAVETTDWPESTVTFVIGGAKNDMVDYVLYNDQIYISSHFTMGLYIGYDVKNTMSRYPVMTALGNLSHLTVQQNGGCTEYVLTRTEQVAENNELVTDADGHVVYDVTVTRNGDAIDYAAFEAAYNALSLATVSGSLPEGESVPSAPHTVYTFTDINGTEHTVALSTFDVLHDAVSIDGHQVFYLIKGGFQLNLD